MKDHKLLKLNDSNVDVQIEIPLDKKVLRKILPGRHFLN